MKSQAFFFRAAFSAASFFLLAATGCVTMADQQQADTQRAEIQTMQEKVERMKVQVDALVGQQELLNQQIQQLRAMPADRVSHTELQAVQSRVTDLDRRIASVDAARAQDKQEMLNTLSANMAKAINQATRSSGGGTSSGSRSRTSSSGTAPAPSKGYEHIVAAGDTISAIASAYKVRVQDIINANNLKDPAHLKVGQKLFIPAQ